MLINPFAPTKSYNYINKELNKIEKDINNLPCRLYKKKHRKECIKRKSKGTKKRKQSKRRKGTKRRR